MEEEQDSVSSGKGQSELINSSHQDIDSTKNAVEEDNANAGAYQNSADEKDSKNLENDNLEVSKDLKNHEVAQSKEETVSFTLNLIFNNGEKVKSKAGNDQAMSQKTSTASPFVLFMKKNLDYIIPIAFVIVTFILLLAVNGCQPFGNNSALFSDTYSQVITYFKHFFDLFEHNTSLFYSNYYAKGVEIFSTLQYMFTNPFYIIVLLGGKNNIILFTTFSELLMLIFIVCTFIWFSRRHFKQLSTFWRVTLAILFIFSGYINFDISFLSWIIYPAITLIVLDRFICFIETDKILGLICSIVWYVVTCYSVGISTVLILFILMVGYLLIVIQKPDRAKKLTKLFIVYCISALLSLSILLPAIMSVLSTSRSGSFFMYLIGVSDRKVLSKISIIFFDIFPLMITILYFIKCKKKDNFNKFLLFCVVILFLPVLLDSIMRILCLGIYQGFSNRFYFLNEIFLFFITQKFIIEQDIKVSKCKNEKLFVIILCLIWGLLIVGGMILFVANFANLGINIKDPTYKDTGLTKLLFSIFIMNIISLLIVIFFNFRKVISPTLVKVSLVIVLCFSIVLCSGVFISSSQEITDKKNEVDTLLNDNNIIQGIKFIDTTQGSATNYGNSRNYSIFSSLVTQDTLQSFENLGYRTYLVYAGINTGSLISDVLAGGKYYVTEKQEDRPYLSLISKTDNFYLYENTLAGDGVVTIDSNFEFDDNLTAIENFERLSEFYGTGKLFSDFDFETKKITVDDYNFIELSYIAEEEGIVYFNGTYDTQEIKLSNSDNGEDNLWLYEFDTKTGIQDVGYVKAGEKVTVSFILDDENYLETATGMFLNYNNVKNLISKLGGRDIKVNFTTDGYEFDTTILENETMYISIPDINGMHYMVNDEDTQIEHAFYKMVKLKCDGDVHFKAYYKYPNLKIWAIVALISIFLTAIIAIIYNKTKFNFISKVVSPVMIGIFAILIVIIYVVGTLFSAVWFFV